MKMLYHIGFHDIGFGYFRVQNDYVTDKFPKVIPAWPVAGYAICEIPVVCSFYAKIAGTAGRRLGLKTMVVYIKFCLEIIKMSSLKVA